MTRVVVAVDDPRGADLAADLVRADVEVVAVLGADDFARGAQGGSRPHPLGDAPRDGGQRRQPAPDFAATVGRALDLADVVVLEIGPGRLTPSLVAVCDRAGTRLVVLHRTRDDERLAEAFGVSSVPMHADAWVILDAGLGLLPSARDLTVSPAARGSRVIAVWGPAGAPGRSTVSLEFAAAVAGHGRRAALVDADSHAPSVALRLGIADEGPGFAAACRQADRRELDSGELDRISVSVAVAGERSIQVLPGINRPSRWPELAERRVEDALEACRGWVEHTIVDVAAPLERDEEIVSDLLDGPRRNAATLAALRSADRIIAVMSADPLGMARFLRAHADLRAAAGATPVSVVANRLRPGALGLDARGQIRRTLERFTGIRDVWFLPHDPRSADAAALASQPVAVAAPRSPLAASMRAFAASALDLPSEPALRPGRHEVPLPGSRRRARSRSTAAP